MKLEVGSKSVFFNVPISCCLCRLFLLQVGKKLLLLVDFYTLMANKAIPLFTPKQKTVTARWFDARCARAGGAKNMTISLRLIQGA